MVKTFIRQIEDRMSILKINRSDLARRLNISRPAVTQYFNDHGNMRMNTMTAIARAVGLEVHVTMQEYKSRCPCCVTSTEAEMISRHGTLASFEESVHKAVPEFLSYREAEEASERYRLDLANAASRDERNVDND